MRRILLVDDEPSTVDMLRRLLHIKGYDVTTATTAAEAVALARGSSFDLILTDIHLPDRSGAEIVRELNAVQKIPAIALTGWAPEDMKPEEVSLFVTVLVKPVAFDKLLLAIRQALGQ
ncbi:MAG TPA: response regulator [Tepidisphaeraceae bacterium]|nr:response regulator [Tepidisphaeraceae bacterium]